VGIAEKVEFLRHIMVSTAEKHGFNLQNPEVLAASRELDQAILLAMRVQPKYAAS